MSLRGRSGLLPKWLNSMLNNTYLSSVDKLLLAGESFKDFLRNDYCLPYFLLYSKVAPCLREIDMVLICDGTVRKCGESVRSAKTAAILTLSCI